MDDNRAIVPSTSLPSLAYMRGLAQILAASGYFSGMNREQAVAKIQAGAELGIPPMAALQSIYFYDGKLSLSAQLIGTLIQRSDRWKYRVRVKTATECRLEFFEDGESVGVESFTIEEAKQAGLYPKKDNWRNYPKAMLFSRCLTAGARTYCPAVFGGQQVYVPDEVAGDRTINAETGEIVDATAVDVTPTSPPASTAEKIAVMAALRQAGAPDPAAWLDANDLPPVAQLTAADAARVHAFLAGEAQGREAGLTPRPATPPDASDAPTAPEETETTAA